MKKLIPIFFAVAAIACNNAPDAKQESSTVDSAAAVEQYAAYMETLSPADPAGTRMAADKLHELFKGKASPAADVAFTHFIALYARMNDTLNTAMLQHKADYAALIYEGGAPSAAVKAYQQNLKQYGFEVRGDGEGNPMVSNNWTPVDQWFVPLVTTPMKAYIGQMKMEHQQWLTADAGIVLGSQAFADRVIWWEKFNAQYPDFVLREQAQNALANLLHIFLTGMDNTPLTYNGQLNEYFETAYTYLLQKYPASKTAALVSPYLKTLKEGKIKEAAAYRDSLRSTGQLPGGPDYNE